MTNRSWIPVVNGYGDTWYYYTKDKQIVGADKAQTQGRPFVANFLQVWANGGMGGVGGGVGPTLYYEFTY